MKSRDFIKWIYPKAKNLGEIDPLFVTAQAALESGWGKHAIGNNLFGITKGSWKGAVQLVTTTEYFKQPNKSFRQPEKVLSVSKCGDRYKYIVKRLFRDYNTVEECLQDHLSILQKPGYSDAWGYRKDARKYVSRIMDNVGSRYATSPDYVQVMHRLIEQIEKTIKEESL